MRSPILFKGPGFRGLRIVRCDCPPVAPARFVAAGYPDRWNPSISSGGIVSAARQRSGIVQETVHGSQVTIVSFTVAQAATDADQPPPLVGHGATGVTPAPGTRCRSSRAIESVATK